MSKILILLSLFSLLTQQTQFKAVTPENAKDFAIGLFTGMGVVQSTPHI